MTITTTTVEVHEPRESLMFFSLTPYTELTVLNTRFGIDLQCGSKYNIYVIALVIIEDAMLSSKLKLKQNCRDLFSRI